MSEPGVIPDVIPYANSLGQPARDAEQLRLLSIFHYVVGGLMTLFACIFIIHVVMGLAILNGSNFFASTSAASSPASAPPRFVGLMFVFIGSVAIIVGWTLGILTIVSGISIAKRRRRLFSLIMAGIMCVWFPFGTALGVFTLVVLLRDSVKAAYLANATPPARAG